MAVDQSVDQRHLLRIDRNAGELHGNVLEGFRLEGFVWYAILPLTDAWACRELYLRFHSLGLFAAKAPADSGAAPG